MRRSILLAFAFLAVSCQAYAAGQDTDKDRNSGSVSSGTVPVAAGTNIFPESGTAVPAPVAPAPPAGSTEPADRPGNAPPPSQVQLEEYSANLKSDVFGAQLFTGSFAGQTTPQFNPDYLISAGDRIQLRLWGGFNADTVLTVDPQGNVFLPYVGPLRVAGTRNQDLQRVVEAGVRRVFRANVSSYASLAAAQPVRIFVTGYVSRPGLYNGTSMDSLLHYIDLAGGIDPERGSFLNVQVKRGNTVRATISLYDFLLQGRIPLVQLGDGDVIVIGARQNVVRVVGMAENARRFEFDRPALTIGELSTLAKPNAQVTHVRVTRNSGIVKNTEYFVLGDAAAVTIGNGDDVEFIADKKPGTITVRVEGEHASAQEYVLPYGTRLNQLLSRISFSDRSDVGSLQLFRLSVRDRQKAMLETSMKSLESTILTARSGTSDEARLRKDEADLILQWVARARKIQPAGQVLIAQGSSRDKLLLENGDVIRVPPRDGLVLVSGEVLFPNAIVYESNLKVEDYIQRAGGYTQNAENSRVVVAHRDGSFDRTQQAAMRAGDEVLVLPKVDVKSRQIWKDLTQVIYQIAVSAKVVFGL
jgi:protein involved in polysaccharide export with SLBB domain